MSYRILNFVNNNKVIRSIIYRADWHVISTFGRSKFIRSFSIWIAIVPLLAKIFEKLPSEIQITIFGASITLVCELPFNLAIFYFCAIFFGIASILYVVKCPPVIQQYLDAGDFIKKNGTSLQLLGYALKLDPAKKEHYKEVLSNYSALDEKTLLMNSYTELSKDYKLKDSNYRLALVVLYAIAFILLFLVFIQNTHVVIGA